MSNPITGNDGPRASGARMTDGSGRTRADIEAEGRADARRRAARDMEAAHAQGLHDEAPREGCPECDRNRAGY